MVKSTQIKSKIVKKIYMDYASSVSPNPSSIHYLGVETKKKLENARGEVSNVLNSKTTEIIFTSGGTESNNLAIQGIVWSHLEKENKIPHIITTNIEHPSVLETFKILEKRKLAQISIVPVEINGIIDPKKIKKEIKDNTILVSVMYANNEIGTVQPIREIAKEVRHYRKFNKRDNIFFHVDAVQGANYLDLNVERLGVDLMSLSGSKIEGAGKIGVLYKRFSTPLANIMGGGDQEQGFRSGTENVSEILKFAQAFKLVNSIKEKESKRLTPLRDFLFKKLLSLHKNLIINGDLKNRLPSNVNITIPKIPSDLLVIELSARGVMVSSKSACKSGDGKASYVIQAINPSIEDTDGSLRFSFGRKTSKKDIMHALKSLSDILIKYKKWYNY